MFRFLRPYRYPIAVISSIFHLIVFGDPILLGQDVAKLKPAVSLMNDAVGDQDDLCFWNNSNDAKCSRVIVSDKKANRVFSYSITGELMQSIEVAKPGNIDIRQSIKFGNENYDIVAVNVRAKGWRVRLFSVDLETGNLNAIDGGGIETDPNYGSCLAYKKDGQKLWYITTSEASGVTQYEINRSSSGLLNCTKKKHWDLGKCEGVVSDDESETFYVSVEDEGIWKFALTDDPKIAPELVIPLGRNGLSKDLEGLTLARLEDQSKVIIVSSQGLSKFFVFERNSPWKFRGTFEIQGVEGTDGIDLIQSTEIPSFEGGIFGCHTNTDGHPIVLSPWMRIANHFLDRPEKESQ